MTETIINAPGGRLTADYQHSGEGGAPAALVLHPHPSHRGHMNNPGVYALFRCFIGEGFSTLRFNFREAPATARDCSESALEDTAAAFSWLQQHNPDAGQLWVCGFSFGAWVGMQLLMRRPEVSGFIAVAPPADTHDFTFLAPCPTSGLVVTGACEAVVRREKIEKFLSDLNASGRITVIHEVVADADHFFTDRHEAMAACVGRYLRVHVKVAAL